MSDVSAYAEATARQVMFDGIRKEENESGRQEEGDSRAEMLNRK
jgi:hypothetical protein